MLQQAPKAYRTQINDLLLTALARVISRWTGAPHCLIELEGHGREDLFDDIDLTRTVGWFTSLFPVKLVPAANLGDSIKQIKEQLRAIPDKGLGYGALRYLGTPQARASLGALQAPRITFNYLGQFDGSFDASQGSLLAPAAEGSGREQALNAPLGNWLSLNGQVYGDELTLGWQFSREMFDEADHCAPGRRPQARAAGPDRAFAATPPTWGSRRPTSRWRGSARHNWIACRCRCHKSKTSTRCQRCNRACCSTHWKHRKALCT